MFSKQPGGLLWSTNSNSSNSSNRRNLKSRHSQPHNIISNNSTSNSRRPACKVRMALKQCRPLTAKWGLLMNSKVLMANLRTLRAQLQPQPVSTHSRRTRTKARHLASYHSSNSHSSSPRQLTPRRRLYLQIINNNTKPRLRLLHTRTSKQPVMLEDNRRRLRRHTSSNDNKPRWLLEMGKTTSHNTRH